MPPLPYPPKPTQSQSSAQSQNAAASTASLMFTSSDVATKHKSAIALTAPLSSSTSAPGTPQVSKFKRTIQTKHSFKKTKSSSLDNEIFLSHQKTAGWEPQMHYRAFTASNSLGRAASTASIASTGTTNNFQEHKMEIINQGKCLCGQYIRARLRRAGVLNRKALQRLRTILEPSSDVVYEVFPALNSMGEELERMHPRVYSNVSRQLSRAPFGELEDSDSAPMLLNLVAKDLFRSSITWGKIISIFAVCGGFAIDCVRQGHYDYLQFLIDGIAEIIEDDLVHWLAENGGWLGLQKHIRPQVGQITFLGWLSLFVAFSSGVYVISSCVKHIGCHLYSLLF